MTTTIVPRVPRVRCHCGKATVVAICHHCDRPLCHDHMNVAYKDGLPLSVEFADLDLDPSIAPVHCDDDEHVVKGRNWKAMFVAGGFIALGVGLMFVDIVVGLLVLLVGAAALALLIVHDRKMTSESIAHRPPVPVAPLISSVVLQETVRGKLVLDATGSYRGTASPVEGELLVELELTPSDHARVGYYRTKYRLADDQPLDFSAGYAVLDGRAGLHFTDNPANYLVTPLNGPVSGHPLFSSGLGGYSSRWHLRRPYTLHETTAVESTPMWLTPSLVPEQDQRTLELELQWRPIGPDDGLPIERLEKFRLLVPVSWGEIEGNSHDVTVGRQQDPDNPDESVRVVQCARLPINRAEREDGRVTFRMRFQNKINLTDVLRGEFVAQYEGTLSGAKGVEFYHPLGLRRKDHGDQKIRTNVEASFSLSLAGVRYQDLRVIPDRGRPEDAGRGEMTYSGVAPDYETVSELTTALSEGGYYVKRVVENQPSHERSSGFNRYWDIGGRQYDGVYPIDFHLVLIGEEVHDPSTRRRTGNTTVRITVQGAYTGPVGDSDSAVEGVLESKIVDAWEHLKATTDDALSRRVREADRRSGPILSGVQGRTGERSGSAPTGMPGGALDTAEEVADLLRKRKELVDQLLRKDISEDLFRELKSMVDRELLDLGWE